MKEKTKFNKVIKAIDDYINETNKTTYDFNVDEYEILLKKIIILKNHLAKLATRETNK